MEYDFYNPNNIVIIDRRATCIPEMFINTRHKEVNKEIVESYSIRSFVKSLLDRTPIDHIITRGPEI